MLSSCFDVAAPKIISGTTFKLINSFASLFVLVLLSGCGTFDMELASNWSEGRFQENVLIIESRATKRVLNDEELYILCLSYTEIRDYQKSLKCSAQLISSINNGTRFQASFVRPADQILLDAHIFKTQVYLDLGKYAEALAVMEQAQMPRSFTGSLVYPYKLYGWRGLARALTGRAKLARDDAERADSVAGGTEKGQKTALVASIYIALKDYSKAEAVLAQSTDAGFLLGFAAPLAAGIATTMGGDPSTVFKGVLGRDEINTIRRQFMLGIISVERGDHDQAATIFDGLLKVQQITDFGSLYWKVLRSRASLMHDKNEIPQQIDLLKKAVDAIERQRGTIDAERSRIGFIGDKQSVYTDLVAALVEAGLPAEAFEYAERAKARALVDLLASKKSFGGSADAVKIAAMLAELDRLEMDSLKLVSAETGGVTRGLQSAKQALSKAVPEVASLISVTFEKAAAIQSRLRGDEAIVEYFYQGEEGEEGGNLYAFVVTREGIKAQVLNAKGLAEDVESFRLAINNFRTDGWSRWASKLHARLIQPLQAAIRDKPDLTFVPHGVLHYLPFNALQARDGRFLIEDHTVRLLPSASVLKFLNKETAPTQGLLVFGNPDLNDPSLDLPGAEAEAMAISSLWADSKVILRKNATETVLKKVAGAFKYLHLASHGQFNPDDPLESRMLLAPDSENDGSLTVPEIYDLHLSADIVVLSACQTALGDVKNGDDVVGLNRGFLYAGAKSIVGSLWEVPDNPTKDLMLSLYQNLKSMELRAAMQKAQLSALKKYKHPIAWAAFQVTGGV